MADTTVKQLGRITVRGQIKTMTGLHIGGSCIGLAIGGADSTVIRNGLDGRPYIPGSSLKGKMRSLLDRVYKADKYVEVIRGTQNKDKRRIHLCESKGEYETCFMCHLFGITPEKVEGENLPTRLIFRDASMSEETANALDRSLYTDMPMTQVKTEVVIDRITSAATPRQIERVPAGALFEFEMIMNIYRETDLDWLPYLTEAMDLLEHDYLGGQGSRGYGQVRFADRTAEAASFNGLVIASDARYAKWAEQIHRNEATS